LKSTKIKVNYRHTHIDPSSSTEEVAAIIFEELQLTPKTCRMLNEMAATCAAPAIIVTTVLFDVMTTTITAAPPLSCLTSTVTELVETLNFELVSFETLFQNANCENHDDDLILQDVDFAKCNYLVKSPNLVDLVIQIIAATGGDGDTPPSPRTVISEFIRGGDNGGDTPPLQILSAFDERGYPRDFPFFIGPFPENVADAFLNLCRRRGDATTTTASIPDFFQSLFQTAYKITTLRSEYVNLLDKISPSYLKTPPRVVVQPPSPTLHEVRTQLLSLAPLIQTQFEMLGHSLCGGLTGGRRNGGGARDAA
jgi:hypothetical protein